MSKTYLILNRFGGPPIEVPVAPENFVSGVVYATVEALQSAFPANENLDSYGLVEGNETAVYKSDGTDWLPTAGEVEPPFIQPQLPTVDFGTDSVAKVFFENISQDKVGCVDNPVTTVGYTAIQDGIDFIKPGESKGLYIINTTSGPDTGTVTVRTPLGPQTVNLTSNNQYMPSVLTGYIADYDFQSDVCIRQPLADNIPIDKIYDRSPSNFHSIDVRGVPLYRSGANGLNSFGCLTFSSANETGFLLNDGLRAALAASETGEYVAVVVATTTTSSEPFGVGNNNGHTSGLYPLAPGTIYYSFMSSQTNYGSGLATGLTSPHVMSVQKTETQGILTVPEGTAAVNNNLAMSNSSSLTSLPGIYLDRRFQGKIGQVIVFNRVLTSQERTDLFAWLEDRWGIS